MALVALALAAAGAAMAQDPPKPVYRCPGPPVLYTDALSATEARDKGCRTIEGAAITVVQAPPRARANGGAAASTARPGEAKVDPASQRARDSDARRNHRCHRSAHRTRARRGTPRAHT